jgi:hypothetical protein
MGKSRLELHEVLCNLLGSRNVYFQPPPSVQMKYEAIVYSLNDISVNYADDIKYKSMKRYSVIAISKNPDSELCDKLLTLPYSELDRFYTADNLNHWVITLYF